jgi:hypothetical protein
MAVRCDVINEFKSEYQLAEAARIRSASSRPTPSHRQNDSFPILHALIAGIGIDLSNTEHKNETFENEYDRWITHQTLPITTSSIDVCEWWKVNSSIFPRVAMMARDYLGVPATSVPSEIAFSKAGCILSERRARLGDDSVQATSELFSFMKFNKE